MSNPGVGLQMTSRRTFYDERSLVNNMTPGPQSYDVQFKLSDREKRQNELLSRRYVNWKRDSSTNGSNDNNWGVGVGGETKLNNTSFTMKTVGTGCSSTTKTTTLNKKENNIGGVGLTMTSLRSTFGTNSSPSPPYYNVEFKLTNAEKRQNEILSHRYEMHC